MKPTRVLALALLALILSAVHVGAIGQRFLQRDADQYFGRIHSVAEGIMWMHATDAADHCFGISQRRSSKTHKIRIGDMYRVWVTNGDATAWDHKRGRTESPPGPNPCIDNEVPTGDLNPDEALQILLDAGLEIPVPADEATAAFNWRRGWIWATALPYLRRAAACVASGDRQLVSSPTATATKSDLMAWSLCLQINALRQQMCSSKAGCDHHSVIAALISMCDAQASNN